MRVLVVSLMAKVASITIDPLVVCSQRMIYFYGTPLCVSKVEMQSRKER
jgi:hypothetical protein